MQSVLQINGLNKSYGKGDSSVQAVRDLSFTAEPGEILGILGPNGSGKTTTLKAIAGLTTADSGDIRILGRPVSTRSTAALQQLGALLEGARNTYWRLSVLDNLLYFAGIRGIGRTEARRRAEQLITTLQLETYRHQEVRELSKGNQQKTAVACAVIHQPALILLDEPTLGLDVDIISTMRVWLRELLQDGTGSLLITSHDLDFIEQVCDRVIIIYKGQLLSADSVSGLRQKYRPLKTLQLLLSKMPDAGTLQQLNERHCWSISQTPAGISLSTETADLGILSPALSLLLQNGCQLFDIHVSEDSLEDIFLRLIREEH